MAHFYTRFTFIGGFFVGVALALIICLIQNKPLSQSTVDVYLGPFVGSYEKWFRHSGFEHFNISYDLLRYTSHNYKLESQLLHDIIKITCVILVYNINNTETAKATWVKHCNSFSIVNLTNTNLQKRGNYAWLNLCLHLKSLPQGFDWVLVVQDDTFVLLENIRYFVAGLDAKTPYYLGHAITFWGVTYNIAQSGYLLNNAAVSKLKNHYNCQLDFTKLNSEDYYLGKALFSLNITPSDTRDSFGLSTFHGFNLLKLFFPGSTLFTRYYKFNVYPIQCCSYNSITFKISASDQMFTYEYLLYQLQIFKYGQFGNGIPTTNIPDDQVWKEFVKERGISNTNIDSNEYHKLWEEVSMETI